MVLGIFLVLPTILPIYESLLELEVMVLIHSFIQSLFHACIYSLIFFITVSVLRSSLHFFKIVYAQLLLDVYVVIRSINVSL